MTGPTDAASSSSENGNATGRRVASALRLAALALVIVGFVGWATEDAAFDLESPYTIAFGLGVACAIASIYLGIFLAESEE
ncbi:hypothetical protein CHINAEXTREME_04280 [Halobiforma lacisalsi AJ5]|uniref:Solute carrier family 6, member 8 n=2 Tax=Natronobacterium TaxID=2256 RepID=M0LQM8_NATLA|nr:MULTISPECIES: hypothetical protein [Halobiforma]APW97037.1 hypothetical protein CHINAEXTREME_04280 [Halobiforma lacisalsi AJ5]EMA34754.1 solute carrier family 6, member 8 [Halobiforma lacisalsi AJ5]SFC25364.1 hypothetical protein SAMN05444422_10681 [Halobiforma haloterrestris]